MSVFLTPRLLLRLFPRDFHLFTRLSRHGLCAHFIYLGATTWGAWLGSLLPIAGLQLLTCNSDSLSYLRGHGFGLVSHPSSKGEVIAILITFFQHVFSRPSSPPKTLDVSVALQMDWGRCVHSLSLLTRLW